jgi:hypothetical protein
MTHFTPLDEKEHACACAGANVDDYCAHCSFPFLKHNNGKCPPFDIDAVIFKRDGKIYLSTERENSYLFADYYGEYRGGYPWVSEFAENYAKSLGGYWEWENPGCLVLIKV